LQPVGVKEGREVAPVHSRPLISVAATTGLLEAIAAGGSDPDLILRGLGVEPSVLRNAEGFIASSLFARILEETARATGDDCFGLHFGERYNPKNIGPLAYAVLNSPTLAAAIENAERYLHIHNGAANPSFSIEGEAAYVRFLLVNLAAESARQHNEYSMAVLLSTFRLMAGSHWDPREVQFAHDEPARTVEHFRVFRAPVLFNCGANSLVIEREFVER
jgi:hypothetical protein